MDRIRAAARHFSTQQHLADAAGIPKTTLQKILAGDTDPGFTRMAKLAGALGLSLDFIVTGAVASGAVLVENTDEADLYALPVVDIAVSAGNGTAAADHPETETVRFPTRWLRRFGELAGLRMARIDGDSQEPELRDGDWLMFDTHRNQLGEGLHVVRLDDYVSVKRVQVEGRDVRLTSANPVYRPIVVDIAAEPDRLSIIGRAVWTGTRML